MTASAARVGAVRTALITLAAIALILALRLFPQSPSISHMDFLVLSPGALQFCDPLNPQFLAVAGKTSPASISVVPNAPPKAGRRVDATLNLSTVTGKPVAPGDLAQTASAKLNLLIVDPTLTDFQISKAEYDREVRQWYFAFTPRKGGLYRIFADFTPVATGKELYISTDLPVSPAPPASASIQPPGTPSTASGQGSYLLQPSIDPIPLNQPVEFTLEPNPKVEVRLAIFDAARNGMAFLHPSSGPLKVSLSYPGSYTAWALCASSTATQPSIIGPFHFSVSP